MIKLISILTVTVSLAACSTGENVPQGPPAWREGFSAGCNSGYVAAGHPYYQYTKDVNRAQSDQTYNMGWQDGFNKCKGAYDSIGRR